MRATSATYGLALPCYALRSLQLARPQPPHLLHQPEAPVAAKHAFQKECNERGALLQKISHCLYVEEICAAFKCKLASVAIFSARKPFG